MIRDTSGQGELNGVSATDSKRNHRRMKGTIHYCLEETIKRVTEKTDGKQLPRPTDAIRSSATDIDKVSRIAI